MKAQTTVWEAVRLDLKLQGQLLELLKREMDKTREVLPEGQFHPESGEPLDLAACLIAQYNLFETEYLTDFRRHLDEAIGWFEVPSSPKDAVSQAEPPNR